MWPYGFKYTVKNASNRSESSGFGLYWWNFHLKDSLFRTLSLGFIIGRNRYAFRISRTPNPPGE